MDPAGRVNLTASDAARAEMGAEKRRKEIVTIALLPAGMVWLFDTETWQSAVLKKLPFSCLPNHMYEEGSDQ